MNIKNLNLEKPLKRKSWSYKDKIKECYGLDTETLKDGTIFLLTDSFGNWVSGHSFNGYFRFLTKKSHRGKIGYFYNLRFDVDAIFNLADEEIKKNLVSGGWFKVNGFEVLNTVYKGLKIRTLDKHKYYQFFDIANFFPIYGLDECSKTFLGKAKKEIGSKSFTKTRVKKEYKRILEYCINDAVLTKELAEYWQRRIGELGFTHYAEYSIASYSKKLFSNNSYIPLLKFIDKDAINFGYKSYRGGRFELLQKGTFEHVWEYDLNSAYSTVIKELTSLNGKWEEFKNSKNLGHYEYAFLDCELKQTDKILNPQGWKYISYCYPSMNFKNYFLSKSEFEFLEKYGFDIKINEGIGLKSTSYFKPFKREVERLLKLREKYKDDPFMNKTIKKTINCFYGLQIQRYKKDGELIAGGLFNPIYAPIITSEIKSKILNLIYSKNLSEDLISINTDAVHITKNLGELDGYKKKSNGERGRYLYSGIYEIEGVKSKNRCFSKPVSFFDESQFDLSKNKKSVGDTRPAHLKESLPRPYLRIGKWYFFRKFLTLDNDLNRAWEREFKNWGDFFKGSIDSRTLRFKC